jgi:hypothetical protein
MTLVSAEIKPKACMNTPGRLRPREGDGREVYVAPCSGSHSTDAANAAVAFVSSWFLFSPKSTTRTDIRA